jgi:hypothetical protein
MQNTRSTSKVNCEVVIAEARTHAQDQEDMFGAESFETSWDLDR